MMLSGEAATGKFPCEAVMAEASAALEAESVPGRRLGVGAIGAGVFRRF